MDLDMARLGQYKNELGYWPTSLNAEGIDRHRRLNNTFEVAPNLAKVAGKFAHMHSARSKTS